MGKILDAFADGRLCMEEEVENRSKEEQWLSDKAYRLQEELEQKLDDEERALLEELMDTVFDECCCYAQKRFVRGYRLGVLMTVEVFQEKDTYVLD